MTVRTLLAAEAVARKGAARTRATARAATGSVGNGSAAADGIIHECNVQGFQMVERLRRQHPQQCQDTQNAPPRLPFSPRTIFGAWPPTPSRCLDSMGVILLSTLCHSDPGDRATSLTLVALLSLGLARRGEAAMAAAMIVPACPVWFWGRVGVWNQVARVTLQSESPSQAGVLGATESFA